MPDENEKGWFAYGYVVGVIMALGHLSHYLGDSELKEEIQAALSSLGTHKQFGLNTDDLTQLFANTVNEMLQGDLPDPQKKFAKRLQRVLGLDRPTN